MPSDSEDQDTDLIQEDREIMEERSILTQTEKNLELARSEIAILSSRLKSHEKPEEKPYQGSKWDTTTESLKAKPAYASQLVKSIKDLKEINCQLASMINSKGTILSELISHCNSKKTKAQEMMKEVEQTLETKRKIIHNLRCLKEGVRLCENFDNYSISNRSSSQPKSMIIEAEISNLLATTPRKHVEKYGRNTELILQTKYDIEPNKLETENEKRIMDMRRKMQIELQNYATLCEQRSAEHWQNQMSLLNLKVKEKENKKLVQQIKRERLVISARYNLGQQLPQLRKKFHDDIQQESYLYQCPHFECLKKEVSHLFQEIYRESDQQHIKSFDQFLTGVVDLIPVPSDQIINAYKTN